MQVGGELRHIDNAVIMSGFFRCEADQVIFCGYRNVRNGIGGGVICEILIKIPHNAFVTAAVTAGDGGVKSGILAEDLRFMWTLT